MSQAGDLSLVHEWHRNCADVSPSRWNEFEDKMFLYHYEAGVHPVADVGESVMTVNCERRFPDLHAVNEMGGVGDGIRLRSPEPKVRIPLHQTH